MSRLLLSFLLLAPLAAGCGGETSPQAAIHATAAADLSIQGMTCASCAVSIRTAAKKLSGVSAIDVDAEAGSARVTYDPSLVDAATIAATITDLGYAAAVVGEGGA